MVNFGTGPPLREKYAWLRDDAVMHAKIIDVVERNSVIAGLPPFTEEFRRQLLQELEALARAQPPEAPPQ